MRLEGTINQAGRFEATEAHISKRGSHYLRHTLWQTTGMAVQNDPDLIAFYQTKRQQGKHHNDFLRFDLLPIYSKSIVAKGKC